VSVYVFAGPTISPTEASRELQAVYLPPAAEGDVYRVTLRQPQAIGIIDGYFNTTPTVRHKEILWAMSRGIHVFGSASVGALRAAELVAFGMEGVGMIFEWYRDGILEDDDEVAIVHGPAEAGWVAGSEAMVDIRQTLGRAEHVRVISPKLRRILEKMAKELFYPDRNYRLLLHSAAECGQSEAELARLRQWLPQGRVSQKREDALAMLRLMRLRIAEGLERRTVAYSFEHTSMWEAASRQSGELRIDFSADSSVVRPQSILDELRFEHGNYEHHNLLALERFFALREADRLNITISKQRRRRTEIAFRRHRGLLKAAQLRRWMDENDLNRQEFDALMSDEARVSWVRDQAQCGAVSCLLEELRLSGDYLRLAARAMEKQRLLESFGLKNPRLKDAKLTEHELLRWYFRQILRRQWPNNMTAYQRRLGFGNRDGFRRALLKEYLYRRLKHRTKHVDKASN
jgi:hypothetical protein